MIAAGDCITGVYLLIVATVELHYNESYCQQEFSWLVSSSCAMLGVTNTIGSQISLLSMTALSLFRRSVVTSRAVVKEPSSTAAARAKLFGTIAIVVLIAVAIAAFPMVGMLEDLFVNGLYYPDNPLFVASVSKEAHYRIFEKFYGRFRRNLKWSRIRRLAREMFTEDHGGQCWVFSTFLSSIFN